jgi:hypothetical protein
MGIVSRGQASRDIAGNRVGSSLRNAIKSDTTNCDLGESTYCDSKAIKGLSYYTLTH